MAESDFWLRALTVCGLVTAIVAALIFLEWLFVTRRTDDELLTVGRLVRKWRFYRWFWFRIGLAIFGWPHVFDAALGTRRAAVAQTPNM